MPVNVGVRVNKIKVYDGNTLVRVRRFTYGNPTTDTSVYPLPEVYIRTAARMVQTMHGNTHGTGTEWTFTLHESPVTDGLALQSARVWYGSVTEEVSQSDNGTTRPNKTEYTYDTAPVHNLWYNTLDRFPSTWEGAYENVSFGIMPFDAIAAILDEIADGRDRIERRQRTQRLKMGEQHRTPRAGNAQTQRRTSRRDCAVVEYRRFHGH